MSEGLELNFGRFMFEEEDEYCRISWTYSISASFGEELPSFIRFDDDLRQIIVMPHSKDQIGEYSVFLSATE